MDDEVAGQAFDAMYASWEFLVASVVVGLAATTYGAYVGARRAGVHHLRHGGWVAVVSALIGVGLLVLSGTEPSPHAWLDALSLALMLPAGVLGGLVASKHEAAA